MAAAESLLAWCSQQLRGGFGLDVSEELVQYILSIENEEEIREYVTDLIQGNDGKKSQFIDELVSKWQTFCQPLALDLLPMHQKRDVYISEVHQPGDQLKKGRRKGRNRQEAPVYAEPDLPIEEVRTPLDLAKAQEISNSSSKKKVKYILLLPGRHSCECLGQKHKLINNCLTCGRIVCEQEGSGPCLFCGTLVCSKEEQDILKRDSNKSQKLLKKLLGGCNKDILPHQEAHLKAGLDKARKHKDKLLEFDKTSVRRTRVIDDESDYFATDSNQWLSKQEREALEKREKELWELRHASRLSRKITIDFAGRQILEEHSSMSEYCSKLDETLEAVHCGTLCKLTRNPEGKSEESSGYLVNPNLLHSAPVVSSVNEPGFEKSWLRIQDRELREISDDGWCLSMHQPWASLLVKGIKRVEGRTWYTSHRGRLWIAATAKTPSSQEISELEATYRVLLQKDADFPKDYPSGCLLGCVDLIDCLSQEQFKELYPTLRQESGSPFVYVCVHPQEMIVKFPIKGKPRICKLWFHHHLCLVDPR
uniref:Activating signal cointegrator 1 n=1 Tax=Sphenodon punctatus TaxID=8508 RepID=A0A8D0GIP2_SPHPU